MGLAGFNRARARREVEASASLPPIPKGPYVKQTEEDKFYCETCDKRFQNTKAYELHMRVSKVHK